LVDVAYTDLRELTKPELSLLPTEERERLFGSDNRRRQFQCGRALLRLMLQRMTGRPAAEHPVTAEEGGKPLGPDGIAISITHTGEYVACCVGERGQIGIDLERIDVRREVSQITERFFSAEEAAWLESGHPDSFFMLWVLKEAFVKAHGQSIFGGLEKLHCVVRPPHIEAHAREAGFRDLSLYRRDDMFLAIATTEMPLDAIEFSRWRAGTLEFEMGDDFALIASTNDHARQHAA
jgi:phosphopantetheine--protein transferase-like protein